MSKRRLCHANHYEFYFPDPILDMTNTVDLERDLHEKDEGWPLPANMGGVW